MTNKPLDFTRSVQTRDGRAVRILCTDMEGPQPVVGAIGVEIQRWLLNGSFFGGGKGAPCELDLVQAPVKKSGWMWIAEDPDFDRINTSHVFPHREAAGTGEAFRRSKYRLVEISWEE